MTMTMTRKRGEERRGSPSTMAKGQKGQDSTTTSRCSRPRHMVHARAEAVAPGDPAACGGRGQEA